MRKFAPNAEKKGYLTEKYPFTVLIFSFMILVFYFLMMGLPATAHSASQISGKNPSQSVNNATDQSSVQGWPRIIKAMNLDVILYQPQVESWDDVKLKGYLALSVTFPGDNEPTYGVLSIEAQTLIDKTERNVILSRFDSFNLNMPALAGKEPKKLKDFSAALKASLDKSVVMSLDHLEASLAVTEASDKGLKVPLQNEAPRIIFSITPAILASIDGDPVWQPVQGTKLDRLVNTRLFILKDGENLYLHFLDGYLTTKNPTENWAEVASQYNWNIAEKAPNGAETAKKIVEHSGQVDFLYGQTDDAATNDTKTITPSLSNLPGGVPPKVYISTKPAELIVSNGEPDYQPLKGTNLLYMANTTANVFKDMKTGESYILIAGRWFKSNEFSGPWSYVSPKNLPQDFAKIPNDSAKENVKASVPGTAQAKEAAIASQIPQTAQIERASAKFTPSVDAPNGLAGAKLVNIESTELQYVQNSPDPIIRVSANSWYALHNAVWFSATSIYGPWRVAESIPVAIYTIPVSSPLHYITYVKIYSVTPRYVVIGYTPGYYGVMLTGDNVVVYGTGYYHAGWVGSYWYGAPVTYGLGVSLCWTPWAGWAYDFGFGWSWGSASYGWWYPPTPWWGPYYYSGSYYNAYGGRTAWGPRGWAGTTGNIYSRWGNANVTRRGFAGADYATGNRFAGSYGKAYNSTTGAMAVGRQGAVENVYSGNYAAGQHGAAFNPSTGTAVRAGRTTVGNVYTGNSATIGHVDASKDGHNVNAGWVRGQDASVGHINNNVFGSKDGQVYRYDPSNPDHWQPVTPQNREGVSHQNVTGDTDRFSHLNQEQLARDRGATRSETFQNHGANFGGNRNFGGGGGGFSRGGGGGRFIRR